MSSYDLGPKPKFVEGGCLCSALRYRIDFSPDHDFASNSFVCQCTLCRKSSSSLFFIGHSIPLTSFSWINSSSSTLPSPANITSTPDPSTCDVYQTLRVHSAMPKRHRAFCGTCGSTVYWRDETTERVSVYAGTVDPLYLWGEGVAKDKEEGGDVPRGGFGRALCSGVGGSEWCGNEIGGVTDGIACLLRGPRFEGSST